jgi:tyrosine-protein phosphatase SIW14
MKYTLRSSLVVTLAIAAIQIAGLASSFANAQACQSCFAGAGASGAGSIKNFSQVAPGIFRGGRPAGTVAFQELQNLGVKTVINLQGGDIGNSTFGWIAGILEPGEAPSWIAYEKKSIESRGMKFVNVPINSLDAVDATQGYGLGRAIALLNDPKNLPVYVHCEHGVDRTGLLIALYRVYYQNWKRQAAYDEMVAMGHGALRQFFTGDMDRFFWAATQGMP